MGKYEKSKISHTAPLHNNPSAPADVKKQGNKNGDMVLPESHNHNYFHCLISFSQSL